MRIRLHFSKPPSLAILFILATFFIGANQVIAKEYIVKLNNSSDKINLKKLKKFDNNIFSVRGLQKSANLIKVNVNENLLKGDAKAALTQHFNAKYVVENILLHALVEANDPQRSAQWALDTVNANLAWDISQGDHSVIVAVIDTGVNLDHEDLKDNIWVNENEIGADNIDNDSNGYVDDITGWDFSGNDNDPNDETSSQNPGHGTHCSGIIGAVCDNNLGICGISPKVSIMPLRFLNSDGSGDLFDSTKAIEYAANNGAHIISASWGAAVPRSSAQPIIDAILAAEEKGVIFVAAASNDGESNDSYEVYPANAQTRHMLSIAASNSSDEKPYWSNYGRKVDIAAPGEGILSTIPGGYQDLSGTSMATPLVAGILALMKSLDADLSGEQARSILQASGAVVSIETASNRRVDANAALLAVSNKQLTLVPAAATFQPQDEYDFSAWGGTPPYRFESKNPEIATIDEAGHLVAVAEGEVGIDVIDANNVTASSVSIVVGLDSPDDGQSCPFGPQIICDIICIIWPDQPFCSESALPPIPVE